MSGVLLDTSVLIAAERETLDLGAVTAGRLDLSFLSVVSAAELLHGVHRTTTPAQFQKRSAFVESALAAFPILEFDLNAARIAARLSADLQASGTMLPAHDLWIAASALAHSLSVATVNARDFARVPNLAIEVLNESPSGHKSAGRKRGKPRIPPAIPPSG